MPSGATHDKLAVAASPVLTVATTAVLGWGLHLPPLEALFGGLLLTASHLACSNWLSPDLDLTSATIDERWGRLRFIWDPYDRAVPHRNWMSHSGFSVLGRLAYLYGVLNLIVFAVSGIMLLQGVLVGLFVSDIPSGRMVAGWLTQTYLAWSVSGLHVFVSHPLEVALVLIGAVFSDALHSVSDVLSTAWKRSRHRRKRSASWHLPNLSHVRRTMHSVSLARVRFLHKRAKRTPHRRYRTSLHAPARPRRRS